MYVGRIAGGDATQVLVLNRQHVRCTRDRGVIVATMACRRARVESIDPDARSSELPEVAGEIVGECLSVEGWVALLLRVDTPLPADFDPLGSVWGSR